MGFLYIVRFETQSSKVFNSFSKDFPTKPSLALLCEEGIFGQVQKQVVLVYDVFQKRQKVDCIFDQSSVY